VIRTLFDTIAPRFAGRPGGYTRIIRLGYRRGDSAEVAQIELVGSEFDPKAAPKETKTSDTPKKTQGVGDRLRAAAERLRGKKEDDAESRKARGGASTKGRAAKKNTPRSRASDRFGIRDSGLGNSIRSNPQSDTRIPRHCCLAVVIPNTIHRFRPGTARAVAGCVCRSDPESVRSVASARAAGLRYVSADEPGLAARPSR
jgi:hypothetical protein